MGLTTTIRATCDYSECKGGQKGPAIVQWVNEEIKAGNPLPPGAAEFVTLDLNGSKLVFCGRLHASEFFLPAGYDIVARKVVDFPDNGNFPKEETE